MAVANLSELYVSESFQRLLQVSSSQLLNGTGSLVTLIHVSGTVSASAFVGDGSGLTGVTGEWDGTRNGDSRITGSFYVSGSEMIMSGSLKVSGSIFLNGARVYKAFLNQSSTGHPTASVITDSLSGPDTVWTRYTTGIMEISSSGSFPIDKTHLHSPILNSVDGANGYCRIYDDEGVDANSIKIAFLNSAGVPADSFGANKKVVIFIEVYP